MERICMFVCLVLLGIACSKCIDRTSKGPVVQPEAKCEVGVTRCAHEFVEICDSSGHWSPVLDCIGILPSDWRCGEQDGKHMCLRDQDLDGGSE